MSPPGGAARPDPTDAHSVAVAATRMQGLRPSRADDALLAVLWIPSARSRARTTPGWSCQLPLAPRCSSPAVRRRACRRPRAKALLARVRPPRCRRQSTAAGRRRADQRPRTHLPAQRRQQELNAAQGHRHRLTALHGIGPPAPPGLLGGRGVTRFPGAHFASWATPRRPAPPGDQVRHLSRAGNRQINRGCTSWPWSAPPPRR
jgi:hypothetical protein